MKVPIKEKCSTGLYHKLYNKGYYNGRKLEAKRTNLIDLIWAERLKQVRESWQATFIGEIDDLEAQLKQAERWHTIIFIAGMVTSVASYYVGHGGF